MAVPCVRSYVVRHCPRALRRDWQLLKAVVAILLDCLHEARRGMQNGACDAFLEISMCCAYELVIVQARFCHPCPAP